ncbi:MAG: hypothetical protein COA78_32560 [Blastopirellula sp.]|nr:MAG: hypothetical protein COA78_32560 [Blastopirellula sp.]
MTQTVSRSSQLLKPAAAAFCLLLVFSIGCGEDIVIKDPPPQPAKKAAPVADPAPSTESSDQDNKGIIGKKTKEVVNALEVLKDPNIFLPEGNQEGKDYLSQVTSSVFTVGGKVSTFGMQRWVQGHEALNEEFPSYEQFMKQMQEPGIEFVQLRSYEMYAYNEETGAILILRDKKLYEANQVRSK